jgi:hypothetical protein
MKHGNPVSAKMALVVLAALAASACSVIEPVQPWEKGTLAQPVMTFDGDRLEMKSSEHVYTSREAATGGTGGVGGGGCGCN